MNRRTFLQSAGVAAVVGLAGCLDGVREHFGLQGVIPIEIHNEGEQTHNINLQARDLEADRQSYEQSYSVTPGETVGPPHLDKTRQSFRVARITDEEEAEVEVVTVTPETELVVIRIYDDSLEVEVRQDDAGEGTAANETNGTDENGSADGNATGDGNGSDE